MTKALGLVSGGLDSSLAVITLKRQGIEVTDAIRRRDALDARQSAPADDAAVIDTSDVGLDQVVDRVLAVVASRRAARR